MAPPAAGGHRETAGSPAAIKALLGRTKVADLVSADAVTGAAGRGPSKRAGKTSAATTPAFVVARVEWQKRGLPHLHVHSAPHTARL